MTWNNINAATTGISVNAVGDHAHTIATDGSHSHAVTVASVGDHQHTFSTNTVGSGQAHNIMQPTVFAGNAFIFSGIGMAAPNM